MTDELEKTCDSETKSQTPEETTSLARITANRANARKSTGPRTRRGKARSRCNALKHGLLAGQILVNDDDPAETPQIFQDLLDRMIDHFQPADSFEQLLVERLAVCYWRLRRAFRYEACSIQDLRYPQGTITKAMRNLAAFTDPFTFVLPDESDMRRLRRYSDMIDRDLNQTFRQLQMLRIARAAAAGDHSPAQPRARHQKRPIAPNEPNAPTEVSSCRP